jgi:dUTP pyrophosphatase|tara:strand:- start:666 stop:1082 length:417 start_codon:yes stop_codon:yes gene_type:complete
MRIRIKKLNPNAVIPKYANFGDAAVDLVAIHRWEDAYGNLCYKTGLAMEIPEGHVGLLFPRSSVSKKNLRLCNSVGVIDSGYRGEIILKFDKNGENLYEEGDRVGQLMIVPVPSVQFVEVTNLPGSDRGDGGFGSTGN